MKSLTIRLPETIYEVYASKAKEMTSKARSRRAHKVVSVYSLIQATVVKNAKLYDAHVDEVDDEMEAERIANDSLAMGDADRASARDITDVFVFRADPYHKLPATYYHKHIGSKDSVKFERLAVRVLESFLNLVLTKERKEKLRNYSQVRGFSGRSLALAMISLIDGIVIQETMGEEVRQMFSGMETEGSAHEAFERGLR